MNIARMILRYQKHDRIIRVARALIQRRVPNGTIVLLIPDTTYIYLPITV